MNITCRQMQKEDIAKVTPLFIEYWNGTGDEWTPKLVYSRVWQVLGSPVTILRLTILWRLLLHPNTKKAVSVQR